MKILHLEDNATDADLVRAVLTEQWPQCVIHLISDPLTLRGELEAGAFDLVLSDFAMGPFNGLDALKTVREVAPETPFIFLSGTMGEDRAIEAVQAGAQDCVLKDRINRLTTAIERALRESGERKQRRAAEQALQRFAAILENTPNFVGMAKHDGRVFYMNQAALRMAGLPANQDPGLLTISQLHPAADLARIINEGIPTALRAGSWIGETSLQVRGGAVVPVSQIIIAHTAEGGEDYLSTIMHDLSAHKEAERHSREQADLLNKTRDAIIVSDLQGKVTFWNHGAERITGWTAGQITGKPLQEVFGSEFAEQLASARKALTTADEWRGEVHWANAKEEAVTLEMRATLIRDEANVPRALLSIGTDITEQKRIEEQFLRAQRLESIGMLAAGIAHDLNNILAPILMAAPMLRERATDPEDMRMLQTLEKSAERGTGLVRQILGFAHGASGAHRAVQVKHLMRDVAAVITETFPKNIRLEERVPSDLWPIRANPTHIHQVLLNLCVNARDAMPNGGRLRLLAQNRVLDDTAASAIEGGLPGTYILLEVEDSGTGIPPDVLKRIWEPFFTTKEQGKGTGLGLPTVRGIVESHHGFIALNTKEGEGTRFSVYFPAADVGAEIDSAGTSHPFAVRGNGELVLVVDDEAQVRDVTAATLAHYGYRVLVAGDGTEAVALFAQRSADIKVVVTDLSMPNLDGAALAGIVRHMNSTVKILTVSGFPPARDGDPATRARGMFLQKPFKADALLQSVHTLLQGDNTGLSN